jgi:hypothetical protein
MPILEHRVFEALDLARGEVGTIEVQLLDLLNKVIADGRVLQRRVAQDHPSKRVVGVVCANQGMS